LASVSIGCHENQALAEPVARVAIDYFDQRDPSCKRLGFKNNGMVLVTVLVVIALLGLAAYTFAELMLTEYRAAIVNQRQAQARALTESGVEHLQEFLRETDEIQLQNGGRYNNPGYFQGNLVLDGALPRDRGRFCILSPLIDNGEMAGVRYGVEDESAKVNLHTVLLADQVQPGGGQTLLMALPGMTLDVADAILDWLDADDEPRENGAEIETYSALGYACKNGPPDTIEELLLVRGVTPDLLFGADMNRNGVIDGNEASNPSLAQMTGSRSEVDRGWSGFLTLYSVEANVRPDGTPRIDLNNSDIQALHDELSAVFTTEWVDFIIAYRQFGPFTGEGQSQPGAVVELDYTQPGNTQLTSVLDLVGARVRVTPRNMNMNMNMQQEDDSTSIQRPRPSLAGAEVLSNLMPTSFLAYQGRGGGGRGGGGGGRGGSGGTPMSESGPSGDNQNSQGGQNNNQQQQGTIIESPFPNEPIALGTILPLLLDYVTVNKSPTIPGRININQASETILRGIPGMSEERREEIVQQIVAEREFEYTGNRPAHRHEHWILCEGIVTLEEMKAMVPFITAGGRVFRAQIVGYFEEEGPASRVEVVINAANTAAGLVPPRVVFWRDMTNLGRGYNLATLGVGAQ
jgi:hypothetical protein